MIDGGVIRYGDGGGVGLYGRFLVRKNVFSVDM